MLQMSDGQRVGLAQVEVARAATKRAVSVPSLDTLPLADFAGGGEVSVFSLERKGGQGREPFKPFRRIGNEGKNAGLWTKGQGEVAPA